MNITLTSALRLTVLATSLVLASASASAKNADSSDRAAELLATQNSVPVKNAGPYVEVGTFKIQVAVKLGQPTARLADGAWLYQNYQVENSVATGALVVRFNQGRVSNLALVSPATATAMLDRQPASDRALVAQR